MFASRTAQPDRTALTPEQQARERSLLIAIALDVAITAPQIAVAIWSASLTMLAELIRAVLLMLLELFIFRTLRRVHRRHYPDYEFGTGKLEQFANILVGSAMLLGAAWIGAKMVSRAQAPPVQDATSLWAVVAVGLANLLLNSYCFYALWQSGRDGTSIIINGQIKSRLAKLLASALVVVAMTVTAAAPTPGVALAADLAGSALVIVVMATLGGSMWRKSLPHLLDRTLDENGQAAINRVLARHFDTYAGLTHVRSRLAGDGALVEIGLQFGGATPLSHVQTVSEAVSRDVAALIPGAKVIVVPSVQPAGPVPCAA
jgi:divalent metal cation (Fe/Co/Zn/Cd) transporter